MLLNQVKGNLDRNLLSLNKFKPNLEQHSLPEIIYSTINMLKLTADQMGVQLKYQGLKHGGDKLLKVMIDKLRVQQILINLIQNAIKFSRQNDVVSVTVDEFVVEDHNTNVGVNIKVTDEGLGVSEEDREHLFKVFFKTKDETSKRMNQGSHGLGLNICQQFARNLGGDLIHNDNVKVGAQFILSLNLKKVNDSGDQQQRAMQVSTVYKFGKKKK